LLPVQVRSGPPNFSQNGSLLDKIEPTQFDMKYFKITLVRKKRKSQETKTDRVIQKFFDLIIVPLLELILPRANHKIFEKNIDQVQYFYLELNKDNYPVREIGFNKNNKIVFLGPHKENIGYLTDLHGPLENKNFKTKTIITKSEFKNKWQKAVNYYNDMT
jgi:hypothetical protein